MRISLQPLVVGALSLAVVAGGGAAAVELNSVVAATGPAPAQEPAAQDQTAAEPAACLAQPGAGSAQAGEQQAGHTGVSFVVPPSTVVQVDSLGQPLAVSTNTGQAPCATDLFVQVAPDGTRTLAGDAVRGEVLEQHPAGPWTPGVAQPLTAG